MPKQWIAKAVQNHGKLHRLLGVKEGTKLTQEQLNRASQMGPKARKMVALAKTLKGFH